MQPRHTFDTDFLSATLGTMALSRRYSARLIAACWYLRLTFCPASLCNLPSRVIIVFCLIAGCCCWWWWCSSRILSLTITSTTILLLRFCNPDILLSRDKYPHGSKAELNRIIADQSHCSSAGATRRGSAHRGRYHLLARLNVHQVGHPSRTVAFPRHGRPAREDLTSSRTEW